MKIAGVVRDRRPRKDGKRKGDVLELTKEEKVPLAVQDAVRDSSPDGEVWCTCKDGFELKDLKFVPNDVPHIGKKNFANNTYIAKGKVKWWKTWLHTQKKSKDTEAAFTVQFKDVLDDYGQPELKVTEFNMN